MLQSTARETEREKQLPIIEGNIDGCNARLSMGVDGGS